MSPSDFFLGSRHFFGYFLPGSLWLSGVLLAIGIDPRDLSGWFGVAGFLAGSYILGYSVHGTLFKWLTAVDDELQRRRYEPDPGYLHSYQTLRSLVLVLVERQLQRHTDLTLLKRYFSDMTDAELEQFCKRYVLEYSSSLRNELNDYEAAINFVTGIVPALVVLAFGLDLFLTVHSPSHPVLGAITYYTLVAISLSLFLKRLSYKRREEKLLWYKHFLILTGATPLQKD